MPVTMNKGLSPTHPFSGTRVIFGMKPPGSSGKPSTTPESPNSPASSGAPMTSEQLHALALEKGMQSAEFMQAADDLMMRELSALRTRNRTTDANPGPAPSPSEASTTPTPPDSKP